MKNWNINPEILLKIPGNVWIYWKNKEGMYLGCNDYMAENLNFTSRKDINGKSDHHLPLHNIEEADYYRASDLTVILSGAMQQFYDTATLQESKLDFLVLKSPIFDINKMIVGTIGFSYVLNKSNSLQIADIQLNARTVEMLRLLVRGKTAKEIAIAFNLSYRTVEHYLEKLKKKFEVSSKADLIDKVIDHFF